MSPMAARLRARVGMRAYKKERPAVATRIYVGNLSYAVDNAQLAQVFGKFGEVVDAHIVTDRDTGRSKGFGFVEMAREEDTQKAIAGLNGTTLGDRTLTVNAARPRADQDRRGR